VLYGEEQQADPAVSPSRIAVDLVGDFPHEIEVVGAEGNPGSRGDESARDVGERCALATTEGHEREGTDTARLRAVSAAADDVRERTSSVPAARLAA
jgi:hypothetical protein